MNGFNSTCKNCKKSCNPKKKECDKCGIRWKRVTTVYPDLVESVKKFRPDLEFIHEIENLKERKIPYEKARKLYGRSD